MQNTTLKTAGHLTNSPLYRLKNLTPNLLLAMPKDKLLETIGLLEQRALFLQSYARNNAERRVAQVREAINCLVHLSKVEHLDNASIDMLILSMRKHFNI